jgi:hypothetical protein
MKTRKLKTLRSLLICTCLAVPANAVLFPAQADPDENSSGNNVLFLLASDIEPPIPNSDPVSTILYSVSPHGQLISRATVLRGSSLSGARNWLPEGVFTINELGRYLIVEYPHDTLCCAIFIPKDDPTRFESVRVVPDKMTGLNCGLGSVNADESAACDLWELVPFTAPEMLAQGKFGAATSHSVCKRQDQPPYTVTNRWTDYNAVRFDGVSPADEGCWLWPRNGSLAEYFLGGPEIPIASLPSELKSLERTRRVSLDAASEGHLVVGIDGKDLIDRNTDVFVQTIKNGRWARLPVLPVAPTKQDKMRYHLFDDWLVTSASAALLAASQITETVIPDVFTVVSTGKQWNDWGIAVEPRTAPDVATLPARRITLWNLADGRRIDLALPEDDSEVVHVFDNRQVLLRIHDKLFFAEIQDSKLTAFTLAAFDSAIPNVHWAFYSAR